MIPGFAVPPIRVPVRVPHRLLLIPCVQESSLGFFYTSIKGRATATTAVRIACPHGRNRTSTGGRRVRVARGAANRRETREHSKTSYVNHARGFQNYWNTAKKDSEQTYPYYVVHTQCTQNAGESSASSENEKSATSSSALIAAPRFTRLFLWRGPSVEARALSGARDCEGAYGVGRSSAGGAGGPTLWCSHVGRADLKSAGSGSYGDR